MSEEPTVQIPISTLNLMKGQCGNIVVLLHRLGYELAKADIEAADAIRSEISLELEYLQRYIPENEPDTAPPKTLLQKALENEAPKTPPPSDLKLAVARKLAEEAEALFIACEMAYTLDGAISCALAKMLSSRITEVAAQLRGLVLVDDIPF